MKQVREMKPSDLDKRLSELRLELMKEHGNLKMGRPVKNTSKARELKKAIARILTVRSKNG
jgi:ribosomal protein L29